MIEKIRSELLLLLSSSNMQTYWQQVSSIATSLLLLIVLLELPWSCHAAAGYSYTQFVGPVTGPEEKVLIRDHKSGQTNIDYIAHPQYQFSYGIEDNDQRVLHNRKETREGDNVHGVYSVMEPDGSLRVVKYTADNLNGFQAKVIRNGVPTMHGYSVDGNYWQTKLPIVETDTTAEDDAKDEEDEQDDDVDDDDEVEHEYEEDEEDFENATYEIYDHDDRTDLH